MLTNARIVGRLLAIALAWNYGGAALAVGNAVDKATYDGWKTYKRQRCETCHGPTAEGGAAFPNLLNSLKAMDKAQFNEVVTNGRNNMPGQKGNKAVMDKLDGLYSYLKGRSDGTVPAGDLTEQP